MVFHVFKPSPDLEGDVKTEGKAAGFQHLAKDLAKVNALEKQYLIAI